MGSINKSIWSQIVMHAAMKNAEVYYKCGSGGLKIILRSVIRPKFTFQSHFFRDKSSSFCTMNNYKLVSTVVRTQLSSTPFNSIE